jgi:hypothetical protein
MQRNNLVWNATKLRAENHDSVWLNECKLELQLHWPSTHQPFIQTALFEL